MSEMLYKDNEVEITMKLEKVTYNHLVIRNLTNVFQETRIVIDSKGIKIDGKVGVCPLDSFVLPLPAKTFILRMVGREGKNLFNILRQI